MSKEKADAVTAAEGSRILNINVGILGHVDSGKTSLVKALSTSLSTAALDKHPQSQQRGITLDLGFSAFTLPMPQRLADLAAARGQAFDLVRFTLVDCPGHASLIRTVIGGAHIIDMMILVIDANKGIQTQTAECIVIGEITTDNLVIALNKCDMLPVEDRQERIEKVTRRIRKTLLNTKFSAAPIVPVSAAVGGEKVAAITSLSTASATTTPAFASSANSVNHGVESQGIDRLVQLVQDSVPLPIRDIHSPLYFAIDHCFPIRGHGTVLTGTVLSGSVAVNQMIELPRLAQQRKVKSMQMFHANVKYAAQGDRVALCVTNLDAKLVERDVACAPESLTLVQRALCLVRKVRFCKLPCKSGGKVHVSVGHSTVLATVTFFGANELSIVQAQSLGKERGSAANTTQALSSSFLNSFPDITFDNDKHYLLQERLQSASDMNEDHEGNEDACSKSLVDGSRAEPLHWALIELQQPVYCPANSLIIGSRLDVDSADCAQCRLAFFGPAKRFLRNEEEIKSLNVYFWKQKECEIWKTVDVRRGLVYEAIGWKLVSESAPIQPFLNLKLVTENQVVGTIVSSYGAEGMFRVKFPTGARIRNGSKLIFKFKRFIFDKSRHMEQTTFDEAIGDTPDPEEAPAPPAHIKEPKAPKEKTGSRQTIDASGNAEKGSVTVTATATATVAVATTSTATTSPVNSEFIAATSIANTRVGRVESVKTEADGDRIAIISGLFRMEENIREFAGQSVRQANGVVVGEVLAPFGKLGKCKIRLSSAVELSAQSEVVL